MPFGIWYVRIDPDTIFLKKNSHCISRYTFSFLACAELILYVQDRSCKHRIDPVPSGLHLAYLTSSDSVVVQPTQQPYLPFGVFDVSFKSFEVLLILVVHLLPNLKI